mgnify:CR=1 FL=1
MRLYITVILFLSLLAIAFIFGSQNEQVLTLNYLIARAEMPVAAAVSLFTGIGFVLGLLFALFWQLLRRVKKSKNEPINIAKKP